MQLGARSMESETMDDDDDEIQALAVPEELVGFPRAPVGDSYTPVMLHPYIHSFL